MPKLNLFLHHHAEGEKIETLSQYPDYLIYWKGTWFTVAHQHTLHGNIFVARTGTEFNAGDDFYWTELPEEVKDNG